VSTHWTPFRIFLLTHAFIFGTSTFIVSFYEYEYCTEVTGLCCLLGIFVPLSVPLMDVHAFSLIYCSRWKHFTQVLFHDSHMTISFWQCSFLRRHCILLSIDRLLADEGNKSESRKPSLYLESWLFAYLMEKIVHSSKYLIQEDNLA